MIVACCAKPLLNRVGANAMITRITLISIVMNVSLTKSLFQADVLMSTILGGVSACCSVLIPYLVFVVCFGYDIEGTENQNQNHKDTDIGDDGAATVNNMV